MGLPRFGGGSPLIRRPAERVAAEAERGDLHPGTTQLAQMARAGSTLLTAATLSLAEGWVQVKPLGAVPIKGLETPIEIHELVGAGAARSRLQAAVARGLSRFVGRDAELDALRAALDKAAAGHGQVVATVGEPGVGKSRLFWELTHSHRVHGWLVLESGAVSYGRAAPYRPVVELLKTYFHAPAATIIGRFARRSPASSSP